MPTLPRRCLLLLLSLLFFFPKVASGQNVIPGDLDNDGDVDIFDYNLLVENFGASECGNLADISEDCSVNIFDYNIIVENFGKTDPGPGPDPGSFAALVPPEYRIAWSPGIPGGIPNYPECANVKDFGATGNGSSNDLPAFDAAIASAANTPGGCAVLVPAGTYRVTDTIELASGVALRGEGYTQTTIECDFVNGDCVKIGDGDLQACESSGSCTRITGGYTKGSNSIAVASTSGVGNDDYIEIRQNDDLGAGVCDGNGCRSGWGENVVGQVVQVVSVSGNTFVLEQPLNFDYNSNMNPRFRQLGMVEGAGVERLRLEGGQGTNNDYGASVHMKMAAKSWVREVWSEKTISAHVTLGVGTYANEVRGNYFNDSFAHNDGGRGYGVRIENRASNNLVEDNIFNRLRHSMLLQLGATGNVFGYNFSRNPRLICNFGCPGWLGNDISVHGHYNYLNLFEGNVAQMVRIDDVWGRSGATTLYRNRIERDMNNIEISISDPARFPYIEIDGPNPNHNIIGNEVGSAGNAVNQPIGLLTPEAQTSIVHGNYNFIDGSIIDPGTSMQGFPASLYRSAPISSALPWPIFGDNPDRSITIPAQQRWDSGNLIP